VRVRMRICARVGERVENAFAGVCVQNSVHAMPIHQVCAPTSGNAVLIPYSCKLYRAQPATAGRVACAQALFSGR